MQSRTGLSAGEGQPGRAGTRPDVLPWKYTGNRLHPTQKPVSILRPYIEAFTHPVDTVLDPFCGSGSTLVAAKESGWQSIGVEIEERYCEVAANRCAQEVMVLP